MTNISVLKQENRAGKNVDNREQGYFRHANVAVDEKLKVTSLYMRPAFRPCYTPELLHDILFWQEGIRKRNLGGDLEPLRFGIFASAVPGFFNTGGDLSRFIGWIREQNRGELLAYATDCVKVAHNGSIALDLEDFEFIALVQGQALGGGFEAALACSTIIAERGTQFGFPEVMFNLFPGMGAYSFLSRRVNPALAERMIMSGQLYSAEELYELGIVSVLAEPGCGEEAVRNYIKQASRQRNARSLISNVRRRYNRVPYEELLEITQHWVECALTLSEKELKVMERLVRAQNKQNLVNSDNVMGG
ncbi:MAG: crotonase/enoyl-CoA hydratase family protein [Gammaproteobacteria bacterium]